MQKQCKINERQIERKAKTHILLKKNLKKKNSKSFNFLHNFLLFFI